MKDLERLVRENSYRHQLHTVFGDFCEMAALAISNSVDLAQREARETRYLEIAGRYNREELDRFAHMLACLVEAFEIGMGDHLGKLFMALELGNHWRGQFFTPYALAVLMAQMQLHDAAELVAARGFVTVSDPCCGAGGMVIAAAQAISDLGLNYQEVLHVTAQDLDTTAAHMAYVQLSLLHVPGIVVVGDTLRMTESGRWYTPAHVVGLWTMRLCGRESEEPRPDAVPVAEAIEASRPEPRRSGAVVGQLDLFVGAI